MPGPFYFAWIDQGEDFNDMVHNREDELIFAFTITQTEGDFASLEIEIANPRVGLLAPGRKTWCWFSWFNGTSIVPLFTGRLIGIPESIVEDVVTLTFIARPANFDVTKLAFAQTLKVSPYYDATWIEPDRQNDPDVVLEGYTRLWNIDRVTLELTTTDIIIGEDGLITLTPLDIFHEGLELRLGQVPLSVVKVTATFTWDQVASGNINLNPGTFNSPAAHKLLGDWPSADTSLEGGWRVVSASAVDLLGSETAETSSLSSTYTNNEKEHASGDILSISQSNTSPVNLTQVYEPPAVTEVQSQSGKVDPFSDPPVNIPLSMSAQQEWTLRYLVQTTLVVGYAANRKRTEIVKFSVVADFQDILTEPTNDDLIDELTLSATGPDTTRAYHLQTTAGIIQFEYLLCLARARLLARCRAVEISVDCRFERSLEFSCRKNFLLIDDRLPGGQAFGKIKEYTISGDGDSGAFFGRVTFACSIGTGNAVIGSVGTPSYADSGYVDLGYQYYDDMYTEIDTGDLTYWIPPTSPSDDGLHFPLSKSQAVLQRTKSSASFRFKLKPVDGGPFSKTYVPVVSTLVAPRQIDLEAL